jgi:predicted PurR-regulated permease PerM
MVQKLFDKFNKNIFSSLSNVAIFLILSSVFLSSLLLERRENNQFVEHLFTQKERERILHIKQDTKKITQKALQTKQDTKSIRQRALQ